MIDPTDRATSLARAAGGNFDAFLGGLEPGLASTRTRNIYQFLATAGVRNYGGYSNPRLDYVLANGLKATQLKARATNYRVAQQIIHDDRPIIYLYNVTTFAAFSTNLTGVTAEFQRPDERRERAVQIASPPGLAPPAMGWFLLRKSGAALAVVFAVSVSSSSASEPSPATR